MKIWVLLFVLSLGAQAQTVGELRVKEEMLERAREMRVNSDEAQELMKAIQVEEACQKVSSLFKQMPDHLSSIMSRMNIFDKRIQKMKDESLTLLRETHRLHNRCAQGDSFEFVDPKKAEKFLKDFSKKMKRHERQIKKLSTSYNNPYYYYY